MIHVSGSLDHSIDTITVVGNITGETLSGLDVQKMNMISGMLSEFQTLTCGDDKEYAFSKPTSISFSSSDLTTVLPYSVSFDCYSSGTFLAEFFGITNPADKWSYAEQEGRVTKATHTVSAEGIKTGSQDPLANAVDFVNSRLGVEGIDGFLNMSLFQTGVNEVHPFLISRVEDINRSKNSYSITEEYDYYTSAYLSNDSGVVTASTSINYDKDGGLSVSVQGSIYGSIDANITGGSLTTGNFPPSSGQEIAVNAVVSSLSDFESGAYSFINRGPTSYNYNVDTGSNKIDFNFNFQDTDDPNQTGNILHKQSYSVDVSKDSPAVKISVNGSLEYNAPFDIMGTGDPLSSDRFMEVQREYSGISTTSGFFNMAVEALQYFTGDATGYFISGDYVNPTPTSSGISKNPSDCIITYNMAYTNEYDLSSGELTGLSINITDKKPIEMSGIVPSLAGFAKQKTVNRPLGEYSVAASCQADSGSIAKLEQVVSGYITGIHTFAKSDSVNEDTISFNLSRYY